MHELDAAARQRVFEHLLTLSRQAQRANPAAAWLALEATHVVGQPALGLHWRSHVHMLRLAWHEGNRPEVAGQLLRLMLTPVGHAVGRLPAGNTGRSSVSAFSPMTPHPAIKALILNTRAAIQKSSESGAF